MKKVYRIAACCMLLGILGSAPAFAQQANSAVPSAVGQITDSTLRDALTQYSPNYDFISRADQIRAYVNIYQSLYSTAPVLTAADNAVLTQPQQPQVAQQSCTVVQPTTVYTCPQPTYVVPAPQTYYYYPYYYPRGGIDIYIGGWGGRRWGGHHRWGPGPRHHGHRGRRR